MLLQNFRGKTRIRSHFAWRRGSRKEERIMRYILCLTILVSALLVVYQLELTVADIRFYYYQIKIKIFFKH